MPDVTKSLPDLIGGSPLPELACVGELGGARTWAELEYPNPSV